MIDIKLIREDPKLVKENTKSRGYDEKIVDEIIKLDKDWRKLKSDDDDLRAKRNKISEEINQSKKKKDEKLSKELIKKAKVISGKLGTNQEKEKKLEEDRQDLLMRVPNILKESVPRGKDEADNKELKKWGTKPKISKPLSHAELGESLDILDLKRATKITGSGFYILTGDGARLQRALIQFMLDFQHKSGRLEVQTPVLANKETAEGTAHLPKFENDMYKTREGFYLIPTAEMTLTNLHRGENLTEDELPKRFFGHTLCFRTEAGRHGAETPGIFRLHQFDKVEMVTLCKPEDDEKEFDLMMKNAEGILKELEIPYRVIVLCSGDSGFKEAITYDIETWSPFLKKYMETSSVSSLRDFQGRRMNTRYHSKKTNKFEFVYTLNGSGLALPRLLISVIENNQQKDGSIKIPKVLWKYTGFKEIKAKKVEKVEKKIKKK
jgi:seryl-tRNA synthetase